VNRKGEIWILSFICFVIYAWVATSIGPALPRLSEDFMLSSGTTGLIVGLYSSGGLFAVLGGRVSDKLDKAVVGSLFLVLFSVSSTSVAFSRSSWSLGTSLLLMGVFAGFLEAVLNPVISNLYPAKRGFSTVMFHTAWNIGSAIGPTFASIVIVAFKSWRLAYLLPAILLVLPSSLLGILGKGIIKKMESQPSDVCKKAVARRLPLLVSTITLFYVAAEMGLSNWLASILESMGSGVLEAGLANGLYWGMMGIGRVVWAFFTDRIGYPKTLLVSSSASFLLVSVASLPFPVPVKAVLWALTGFFFAPIFPTTMAWIASLSPASSGFYSGLAFTNGALGAFLATWSAGIVADVFGTGASQLIFSAFTAFMVLDVVITIRIPKS